jgi:lipopolysaccharide transport system ATP-binding protein
MRGRVGALIALGAGFNPILTGRENIYVNAAVHGLSKHETDARIGDMIAFADLEDFIDAPVQSYSSGMQVRLGFAIATTLDPDILVLDEVLAVGDAGFRHKCYHRINKLMERAAVILVSHSMDYIAQTSTRVMMMSKGMGELFLDPITGIACYDQANAGAFSELRDGGKVQIVYPPIRTAEIRLARDLVQYGESLEVEVEIDCAEPIDDVILSFAAVNLSEQPVMCWHTSRRAERLDLRAGRQRLTFRIAPLLLNNGDYYWNFNASQRGSIEHFIWFMRAGRFSVASAYRQVGSIPYLPDTSDLTLSQQAN